MLVDLKTILADTREKHYAVGLFNCVTLEMTKGILQAAERLDVDAISMGTHGRSGLMKALLGSQAEAVLRAAKIPVMLVPVPRD